MMNNRKFFDTSVMKGTLMQILKSPYMFVLM